MLFCAPPNKGKSSLCLQILARSAPFHTVYVLHGTPGTKEYDIVDHKVLHECPEPSFWKDVSMALTTAISICTIGRPSASLRRCWRTTISVLVAEGRARVGVADAATDWPRRIRDTQYLDHESLEVCA